MFITAMVTTEVFTAIITLGVTIWFIVKASKMLNRIDKIVTKTESIVTMDYDYEYDDVEHETMVDIDFGFEDF